jgi:predicted N-formylglutamate amidohydrolase
MGLRGSRTGHGRGAGTAGGRGRPCRHPQWHRSLAGPVGGGTCGPAHPKALGSLGLAPADLERHIAWDIGAEGLARRLSDLLDATLVVQPWSRLVYDCNRPPEAPDAIPTVSELTPIPGNQGLSPQQREARTAALYRPFHAAVARLIDERTRKPTVLVTVHSFTPLYKGVPRTLDLGILHDSDARLADRLLQILALDSGPGGAPQ